MNLEIVPTRVGVNRDGSAINRLMLHCPHARGGEPQRNGPTGLVKLLSPRAWG